MASAPARCSTLLLGALLCACGGPAATSVPRAAAGVGPMSVAENTNAPPPAEPEPPAPAPTAGVIGALAGGPGPTPTPRSTPSQRAGSGSSRDDPVLTCGAADSYAYVAGEFRCPDGSNPLGGDPAAGREARVGNVGANASGHIIDLYRVPCPSGAVDVFVDLYGCPDGGGGLGI